MDIWFVKISFLENDNCYKLTYQDHQALFFSKTEGYRQNKNGLKTRCHDLPSLCGLCLG